MRVALRRWSAWAPGLDDDDAWRAWAANPSPVKAEGCPDARFLPAMLRRRCTPLTRIMLTAAHGCVSAEQAGQVRTLFASRHGSINESIGMLEQIATRARLSPAKFSHTVHNAQAGLYSIASENRQASSSLSASEDTFGCGFLEALTHLDREPGRPVLFVMGDVPLAETFARLITEPVGAYALALLLEAEGDGPGVELRRTDATGDPGTRPWPDALAFLRWWLGEEAAFELPGRRGGWAWQRG